MVNNYIKDQLRKNNVKVEEIRPSEAELIVAQVEIEECAKLVKAYDSFIRIYNANNYRPLGYREELIKHLQKQQIKRKHK